MKQLMASTPSSAKNILSFRIWEVSSTTPVCVVPAARLASMQSAQMLLLTYPGHLPIIHLPLIHLPIIHTSAHTFLPSYSPFFPLESFLSFTSLLLDSEFLEQGPLLPHLPVSPAYDSHHLYRMIFPSTNLNPPRMCSLELAGCVALRTVKSRFPDINQLV